MKANPYFVVLKIWCKFYGNIYCMPFLLGLFVCSQAYCACEYNLHILCCLQITYFLLTDVHKIRQRDQWHYIAKTIVMFVLAYRQQDPVILGIMKAQFIKIDVEENIACLGLCWLLWKAALVFYMLERVIWVKGKYFCIILPSCSCPTVHLHTAKEVVKNFL